MSTTTMKTTSHVRRYGSDGRGRVRGPALVALLVLVSLSGMACRRNNPAPEPPQQAATPAPPPPAPAPTITLTASQAAITAGQSVNLNWQAQNASSVQIAPGIGTVAASGTRAVSPTSSVTYTATATGPGGTASATARVTVNTPPTPRPEPTPAPAPSIDELFRTTVVPIYFDFDRADIRADQVGRLQASARFLQQNAGVQFTISGHADERGSQEYNIGLGDRRANAIRQFLIGQGIAAARINTVSYGEERPVCAQPNESCWSRNRRGEFAMR